MKPLLFILIILFLSSTAYSADKKWLGKINNQGHITNSKKYRSTKRYTPKAKFYKYQNVYWNNGTTNKKWHMGEWRIK